MKDIVRSGARARPSEDFRRVAGIGIALIVGTFGVLGVWAAVAPLDSAVIGHGVVSVESSRQTVQHFEGGIIRKILVQEGDHVQAGEVLFQLDSVQANASLDIARNQLFSLLAKSARLVAERDHRANVTFPAEVLAQRSNPGVAQAMTDELRQFTERQSTINGQVEILNSRIAQYRTQIDGIDQERSSMDEQIAFLNDEISGLSDLYEKDLVPKSRLLAMERERSQLKGQIGRSIASKSQTQKAIGEALLQARQIRQQFDQDVSKEVAEIQIQIADIRQRFTVAQDTAKRIAVTSPMSGTAQNIRFTTEGAVVRPGEPLVDIAPDRGDMVVKAQFSPNDVDSVHAGAKVELRFSTFHSRTIPVIEGVIHSVSQDRFVDEATHTPYFLAIVRVKDANLPPDIRKSLRAGLPAEVVVPTGSRTAFEYFWQPLTNALNKTMRER